MAVNGNWGSLCIKICFCPLIWKWWNKTTFDTGTCPFTRYGALLCWSLLLVQLWRYIHRVCSLGGRAGPAGSIKFSCTHIASISQTRHFRVVGTFRKEMLNLWTTVTSNLQCLNQYRTLGDNEMRMSIHVLSDVGTITVTVGIVMYCMLSLLNR